MNLRSRLRSLASYIVVVALTWTNALSTSADNAPPQPIFPRALAPGDTIAIVAPAKYLSRERVALAKKRLEAMGFHVRIPDSLFRQQGFLAGSDDQRAAELMAAFTDPEVDAIFPGTGGYGTTRIVDRLDYDVIRRNPKILVGFSDITGLHIAINQKTGLVTFHSPNPEYGLGDRKRNLSPFAAKWFWRALLAKNYNNPLTANPRPVPVRDRERVGYMIQLKPSDNDSVVRGSHSVVRGSPDPALNDIFAGVPRPITLTPGTARGRIIGGNLSVLHALMGTPYEIETDGKILFLEDVGEAPYRVDRMLSTLRLAGKFDHVAGILLGAFTSREEERPWDTDATVDDVLREYFSNLGVPVLMHSPVGHVRHNATLPIGAEAELNATNQTLRILENPASQ